jgi:hypothetical protein
MNFGASEPKLPEGLWDAVRLRLNEGGWRQVSNGGDVTPDDLSHAGLLVTLLMHYEQTQGEPKA